MTDHSEGGQAAGAATYPPKHLHPTDRIRAPRPSTFRCRGDPHILAGCLRERTIGLSAGQYALGAARGPYH